MAPFRIALAGATGNLALPILKALLNADYNVTVLTRIGGNSSRLKPDPNLVIKEVDFNSVESLTPATQKYLLEKSTSYPWFTFTGIANGLFLDWCLKEGIILDLPHQTPTLYNGGDLPFSATTLADIAKGVWGVIEHQAETANRIVYIHSGVVTQTN